MLYSRVFSSILDSSIAEDWQVRHVFEDVLKLADDGILDMTRQAFARRTNAPLEIIDRAITVLESPDSASRDPDEDGRRLVRLDSTRDWGWRIVNWEKYERIKRAADQTAKTRERVARWRENKKPLPPAPPSKDSDSDSDSEAALPNRCTPLRGVTLEKAAGAAPTSQDGVSDGEWLEELRHSEAYKDIDVNREFERMRVWCKTNKKQATRRRFVNWLNRCDRPMEAGKRTQPNHTGGF